MVGAGVGGAHRGDGASGARVFRCPCPPRPIPTVTYRAPRTSTAHLGKAGATPVLSRASAPPRSASIRPRWADREWHCQTVLLFQQVWCCIESTQEETTKKRLVLVPSRCFRRPGWYPDALSLHDPDTRTWAPDRVFWGMPQKTEGRCQRCMLHD